MAFGIGKLILAFVVFSIVMVVTAASGAVIVALLIAVFVGVAALVFSLTFK